MKATVTSTTKVVNVKSSQDHVLVSPRLTDIAITVPGDSTFVEKDFRTIELEVNGAGEYVLDVGKQFFILGYTATVGNIRVRGYVNDEYLDYDTNRPLSQDPLMEGGVLFELVTQPGTFRFSRPVVAYSETVMPLMIESTIGSPVNTTLSFFVY